MRILKVFISLISIAMLSSCDQPGSTADIDPELGLQCYQSQRATLPPGTQYEGIEKLAGGRITIRIMNGVEVVTLECALNADGTLQGSEQ